MKSLQIAALEATGGLVSEVPVEKSIDWYDVGEDGSLVPTKFLVHVLCLPFETIEHVTRTAKSVTTGLIAAGVLFDGGQTKLTPDQAARLAPELLDKLISAFNEVNGKLPGDAGKSKGPTKSGAK